MNINNSESIINEHDLQEEDKKNVVKHVKQESPDENFISMIKKILDYMEKVEIIS